MSQEQAGALAFCAGMAMLFLFIALMCSGDCERRTVKIYVWLGIFFALPPVLKMYITAIAG